jgi:AcrR family transcriptional regulator
MTIEERADAARNRQAILDAACSLFATASDPLAVTMDDVASAAGVGKGTVFRRYGDRAGLLRAVFDTPMAALTEAITTGPPPLGPATPARERIAAVHDAIVEAKLENRQITLALEQIERRPSRSSFFDAPNYKAAHALFCELLVDVVGADRATWTAHALLSLARIDLIEHMVSAEGWTDLQVRRQIGDLVEQILGRDTEQLSPRAVSQES